MHPLFRLRYSLDRPFRWKGFSWVAYGVMLVILAILIPISYASQGYQVVSSYHSNPNITSYHWFNNFQLRNRPGSQCDPHVFRVGDTVRTTIGVLLYQLEKVALNASPNATMSYPYKGESLDWCDVNRMQVSASLNDQAVTVSATVLCLSPDATMTWSTSVNVGFPSDASFRSEVTPWSPIAYIGAAGQDMLNQMHNISTGSKSKTSNLFAVPVDVAIPCPNMAVLNPQAWNNTNGVLLWDTPCTPETATSPPTLSFNTSSAPTYPQMNNVTLVSLNNAVNNVLQTMLATVRFDLGNRQPNNFLSNTSAVLASNTTFLPPFTRMSNGTIISLSNSTGLLQTMLAEEIGKGLPLGLGTGMYEGEGYPAISTSYLCHLTEAKSPGSAFMSVLIGTLSVGLALWFTLIFVATYFARKERPDANYCEYHLLESGGRSDDPKAYVPARANDSESATFFVPKRSSTSYTSY